MIINELKLALNDAGSMLRSSQSINNVFAQISDLLNHGTNMPTNINRTSLHYVDDRVFCNFLKYFLSEDESKLFYFRFFKSFIKSNEAFEIWVKKENWAFTKSIKRDPTLDSFQL